MFDANTTAPQSGFQTIPEGWYILEIQDADKV
jgi:hypothetical protein